MGEGPISWLEIDAWCSRTGIDLDPWEARTIRRLSQAYVSQRHEARRADCPPPYVGDATDARRADISAQVKSLFSLFARPKG